MKLYEDEINRKLHRNIKSGEQYNYLMPFSDCSSVKLGKGDTKVAIDAIALWVKKYKHHTSELSAKLFAKKGLKQLTNDLHIFLYHHFQYKIDGETQKIKSAACSWSTRKVGIDCKSYSAFASGCLLNAKVHHYLRRIKTSAESGYSHVYVIVPKDQKDPKNLNKGYYVVDGTLEFNFEPNFYKSDDIFMEASLPIYGLAGNTEASQVQPMQATNPLTDSLLRGAAQIVDIAVAGLIEQLVGCPAPIYQQGLIVLRIERDFAEEIKRKMADLSDAIKWNNRTRIQDLFNDLFKEFDLGLAHLKSEAAYNYNNTCEFEVLNIAEKYISEVKNAFDAFFENFKTTFTRYKIDEYPKDGFTSERLIYMVVDQAEAPISARYRYIVLREEVSSYGVDIVLPYAKDPEIWLSENKKFLDRKYGDDRSVDFENEVRPILLKIKDLRANFILGGQQLYLLEKHFHREIYALWLIYDESYTSFIYKEAQSLKTANEIAMNDFENRLKKEIEQDIKAQKLSNFKKVIGYSALALGVFVVMKK